MSGAPIGQNLNIKEEIPDDYEPAHYGAFFISFCSVSKITIVFIPWNFDKNTAFSSLLRTSNLASRTTTISKQTQTDFHCNYDENFAILSKFG